MSSLKELTEQLEQAKNLGNLFHSIKERVTEIIAENEALKAMLKLPVGYVSPDNPGTAFDCLAVTNVQVFPFKEGANLGHIKGVATIVLNDQIQIRGLRVMEGEYGLHVGYPHDPFYKGDDFRTICLPMTRQLSEHIENCVLEKYQAAIA